MESRSKLLVAEVAKIQEKIASTNSLVREQQNKLDISNKDIAKQDVSIERAIKELSEAKTNLWHLRTKNTNILKEDNNIRTMCYQRGQDIDDINRSLKDCKMICGNIKEVFHSKIYSEHKKEFVNWKLNLKGIYEKEKQRFHKEKAALKTEIEGKEKQQYTAKEAVRSAHYEAAESRKKLNDLKEKWEENEMNLTTQRETNKKLSNEVAGRQSVLQQGISSQAAQNKTSITKLRKEISDKETAVRLKEQEYESLQKEDAILSTQQQIKKDEYNKLKESVNKLQVEIDTLQTILHHRMLYNKQLVEMCLPSVTAAENISVDDVDLTQCGELLKNELENLDKENSELGDGEEALETINQNLMELKKMIEKSQQEYEKLKSDHLAAELEWNKLSAKYKQQHEKQTTAFIELKTEVDKQMSLLRVLNEEIKEIEDSTMKQLDDYLKKETELEKAYHHLIEEEKEQIQQLQTCTDTLKSLERNCDDLTYDLVKLENRKVRSRNAVKPSQVKSAKRTPSVITEHQNVTKRGPESSRKRRRLEDF